MKIVVDRSVKDQLQEFLEYLKQRATHEDHEANRDLIADFVDKFMVFELKRVANEDDVVQEEIEIPNEILIDPMKEAKARLVESFDEYLKKLGASDGDLQTVQSGPSHHTTVSRPSNSAGPRSGNGHKREKVRDLSDDERNLLRTQFMSHNGQFLYKDCTEKLKPMMGSEIAIWQVTGFVSYLHAEVARGRLALVDLPAYLAFLKDKYPDLSKRYDSTKYQELRAKNAQVNQSVAPQGTSSRPVFSNMRKRP